MSWAADWRVYLQLPAAHEPTDIDQGLSEALATGAVGAVELPLGGLSIEHAIKAVDRFRTLVHPAGVPLIAFGDGPARALAQLDGVRLNQDDDFDRARKQHKIVGLTLGDSRDEAMTSGSKEPDFVYLDTPPDFVAWWAELMMIPCVAPIGDRLNDGVKFLTASPDMIALDSVAWNHPSGPTGAINALAALAASA